MSEENEKNGDLEAKTELIERNMRLVAHVAKKYQNPEDEMEDLISIGTIGLIKAVGNIQRGLWEQACDLCGKVY